MTTSSLSNLKIPTWPIESHSEAVNSFVTKASEYFETIMTDKTTEKPALESKYRLLRKLKKNISSCQFPDSKLTELTTKIDKHMKNLKEIYTTNSHLFMLTIHNRHLEQFTPRIGSASNPQTLLKLNVDDLDGSLSNIGNLKRPVEKMRGLLELTHLIIAKQYDDKEEEIEKLKLVQEFAEKSLTIEEQFMALKQIQMTDKDAVLDEKLTNIVDKTGKNMATYILQSALDWPQKISLLGRLLKDRYQKNPVKSLRSYILDWPKTITELKFKNKNKINVEDLLKQQKNNPLEETHDLLVHEYLLNLLDPTGKERIIRTSKDKKVFLSQICVKGAEILRSVTRFTGIFPKEVFNLIQVEPKTKFNSLKFDDVITQMKSGTFEEAKALAFLLKSEVSKKLTSPNWENNFEKSLGLATQEVMKLADNLRKLIESQITLCASQKEKINMAKAFLDVAEELAKKGEFNLCNYIYQEIDNQKLLKESDIKNLRKLLDPTKNYLAMKQAMAKVAKTSICTPLVLLNIPPKILGLKQALDDLTQEIKEKCEGYLEIDFNLTWETIIENFDKSETKNQAKKDLDRQELVELVQAFVEQKQMFDDFCEQILVQVLALSFPVNAQIGDSNIISKLNG